MRCRDIIRRLRLAGSTHATIQTPPPRRMFQRFQFRYSRSSSASLAIAFDDKMNFYNTKKTCAACYCRQTSLVSRCKIIRRQSDLSLPVSLPGCSSWVLVCSATSLRGAVTSESLLPTASSASGVWEKLVFNGPNNTPNRGTDVAPADDEGVSNARPHDHMQLSESLYLRPFKHGCGNLSWNEDFSWS